MKTGIVLIVAGVLLLLVAHIVSADSSAVFQVDTAGTLETNLLGYWKLDAATSTVTDDFFDTLPLTTSGTVSFVSAKVNTGASVSSSAQIKTTNSGGVDGSSVSFAGWVRIVEEPTIPEPDDLIFAQSAPTSGVTYAIQYQNVLSVLKLKFLRTRRGVLEQSFTVDYTLPLTTSTHLALTFSSTSSVLSGYVSSTFVGSTTASSVGTADAVSEICIGCWRNIAPITDAIFDEWGLWQKELTQTEITDLFNATNGQTMEIPTSTAVDPATEAQFIQFE